LMKRTTAHPIRAFFLERRIRFDNPHEVGAGFQIVNEMLRVKHLKLKERFAEFCFDLHSNFDFFAGCKLTLSPFAVTTLFLVVFVKVSSNKSNNANQ